MASHISQGNIILAGVSTGNNTHASQTIDAFLGLAFQFVVAGVGATPTVTFKVQGSLDPDTTSDANAAWADVFYLPSGSDTATAATQTVTALGSTIFFLDINGGARFYRRYRVVTTSNTNVTYYTVAYARVEN